VSKQDFFRIPGVASKKRGAGFKSCPALKPPERAMTMDSVDPDSGDVNSQDAARLYLRERGVFEKTFFEHGGEIDSSLSLLRRSRSGSLGTTTMFAAAISGAE
jgi:hypothetical protein